MGEVMGGVTVEAGVWSFQKSVCQEKLRCGGISWFSPNWR